MTFARFGTPLKTWFLAFPIRNQHGNGRLAGVASTGQICDYFLLEINKEMADWLAEPALARFVIIFF